MIKHMPEVTSILSTARHSLQGVALRITSSFEQCKDSVEAACTFCRALGKMPRLQTLQLNNWDEDVSKQHVARLIPLKVLLPKLPSTSYLARMAVDAPGLKFQFSH